MHTSSSNKSGIHYEYLTNTGLAILSIFIGVIGLFPPSFRESNLWMILIFTMNSFIFCSALYFSFPPSPRYLKAVFALIFILLLPQFVAVWSERYDDDTVFELGLEGEEVVKPENKNSELEILKRENIILKQEIVGLKDKEILNRERPVSESTLFWLGIIYLYGLFGSLIGCVYAGESR